MGLGNPLPGGAITQPFGHSALAIQPSMWRYGEEKAWWQYMPGWTFDQDVHAGLDFAGKPAGSPLVAMESGEVIRSEYDANNGGGHVIEVQIRPGTRYSFNHCYSRLFGVGAKVRKGQQIATVGATGTILMPDGSRVRSTYGVHVHVVLTILQTGADGIGRWIVYNPRLYMDGQARAGDSHVAPLTTSYPIVTLRPGVNVRSTPDLDVGATNVVYVTRADGVYDRAGRKVAKLGGWQKRGTTTNDDGGWGKLYGLGRYVYVYHGLYY